LKKTTIKVKNKTHKRVKTSLLMTYTSEKRLIDFISNTKKPVYQTNPAKIFKVLFFTFIIFIIFLPSLLQHAQYVHHLLSLTT
jgi:hypothetical protein